jgi:hypothetical protein
VASKIYIERVGNCGKGKLPPHTDNGKSCRSAYHMLFYIGQESMQLINLCLCN